MSMSRPSVSTERQIRRGRPPGRPSGRLSSRPDTSGSAPPQKTGTRGRPRHVDRAAVDEDGTPNIYKIHVRNLKRHGEYGSDILEKQSMDWRATRSIYQMDLDEIARNMAFVPRIGELVLWASDLRDNRLEVNPANGRIEVFNTEEKTFPGRPDWRAGVVAQTPTGNTSLNYLEILKDSDQNAQSITYTGFRLETCVDPNVNDRLSGESHEYCYLNQIRPLSLWQYLLQGLNQDDFHPSIKNALSMTRTVSLAFKTQFDGVWPKAIISCSAVYIGAELYVSNDAVRISSKPEDITSEPYLLTISSINLNLAFTDANLLDDTPFASAARITLAGNAYTTNEAEAHDPETPLSPMHLKASLPPGLSAYGPWYPMHQSGTLVEVPFHHVIGRCLESSALSLMLSGSRPQLDYDVPAIISQRSFACDNDPRLSPLTEWFWADTRAQALSLTSINNEDVGPFDETRDPVMWRGILRVVDGTARAQDIRDARILTQKGRKPKEDGKEKAGRPSILAMGIGLGGAVSTEVDSGSGSEDEMEGVEGF